MTATAGHPFWVPDTREWVDAGELRPGMWVQTSSGTWVQVTAIEHDHREQTVHNLTIDTTHTYSVYAGADAVVTHNCGTGATGSPRLPSQLSGGSATNSVYIGVRAGDDVYVGITNNVARRTDQHGARFDTLQVIGTSLTRGESHAVEQALIVQNSGFENLINSISPRHSFYDQAVEWGRAWLTANGDDMNLELLKRSRHRPTDGDMFEMQVSGGPRLLGRVAAADIHDLTRTPMPGANLIYVFQPGIEIEDLLTPTKEQLLLAPIFTNRMGWTRGYFRHLENRPLGKKARLSTSASGTRFGSRT